MTVELFLGLLAVGIWLYLILGRGGFWLARERDDAMDFPPPAHWPSVVAIVPARNEADVIGRSIGSLLAQDYPGAFRIVLVDDDSDDGTAEVARKAFAGPKAQRLDVLHSAVLPADWTGKLWALQQGVAHAGQEPEYLLLTDADIAHAPDTLRTLVARAEQEGRVLVSLMAQLTNATWAEKCLVPAFVFFFQMLYPFSWIRQSKRRLAAAAGGCVLVRRDALERAGGIISIRSEIIDDCALARRLKSQGPIWLGLTRRVSSLRPYGGFADIGRMISRSAYAQLGYSPLLLSGTVIGMVATYLVPPILVVAGDGNLVRGTGLFAWALMALSFQPILRFYHRSPLWGLTLPAIGATYTLFTLHSALQFWLGRGGMWKGRSQARTSGA